MTTFQTLRSSMDYLAPTTLVAVISDTLEWKDSDLATEIRKAAWGALVANAGGYTAIEMVMDAGISAEDVEDAS